MILFIVKECNIINSIILIILLRSVTIRCIESLRTRNYHVETAAIISLSGSNASMVSTIGAKKTDCAAKSRAKGTITMRQAHLLFASC